MMDIVSVYCKAVEWYHLNTSGRARCIDQEQADSPQDVRSMRWICPRLLSRYVECSKKFSLLGDKMSTQAVKRMGAREARNNFADLLGSVYYGHETVIVERSGKPMVAVIPVDLYEQLMAEREKRFQTLEELLARVPQYPEDEVEADIEEAIAAIRASRYSESA